MGREGIFSASVHRGNIGLKFVPIETAGSEHVTTTP